MKMFPAAVRIPLVTLVQVNVAESIGFPNLKVQFEPSQNAVSGAVALEGHPVTALNEFFSDDSGAEDITDCGGPAHDDARLSG